MKQSGEIKLKIGLLLIGLLFVMCFLFPLIYPVDPNEMTMGGRLSLPSRENILGTDEFGRDTFSRILAGGRISLIIGTFTTIAASIIGTVIGLYSAWFPKIGNFLMRIIDGMMAIPGILLAIALTSVFGGSMQNLIISLTIIYIPEISRIVRATALQVMNESYIEAMQIIGAKSHRIIWKHVFPNVVPNLLVQASFIFAGAILSEASLSYLGAGIPAPTASWGNIIQGGKNVIFQAWWIVLFAAIAVLISVLSFNMVGEGIRLRLSKQSNQ